MEKNEEKTHLSLSLVFSLIMVVAITAMFKLVLGTKWAIVYVLFVIAVNARGLARAAMRASDKEAMDGADTRTRTSRKDS